MWNSAGTFADLSPPSRPHTTMTTNSTSASAPTPPRRAHSSLSHSLNSSYYGKPFPDQQQHSQQYLYSSAQDMDRESSQPPAHDGPSKPVLDHRARELKERLKKNLKRDHTDSTPPEDASRAASLHQNTNFSDITQEEQVTVRHIIASLGQQDKPSASHITNSPSEIAATGIWESPSERQTSGINLDDSVRHHQQATYDDIQELIKNALNDENTAQGAASGSTEFPNMTRNTPYNSGHRDKSDSQSTQAREPETLRQPAKIRSPTQPEVREEGKALDRNKTHSADFSASDVPQHPKSSETQDKRQSVSIQQPNSRSYYPSRDIKQEFTETRGAEPQHFPPSAPRGPSYNGQRASNYTPRDSHSRDRAREWDLERERSREKDRDWVYRGQQSRGRLPREYRDYGNDSFDRENKHRGEQKDDYVRKPECQSEHSYHQHERGRMGHSRPDGSDDEQSYVRSGQHEKYNPERQPHRYSRPTLDDILPSNPDLKLFLQHHNWFNVEKREKMLVTIRELAAIEEEEAAARAKRQLALAKLAKIDQGETGTMPPPPQPTESSRYPMLTNKRSYDQGPGDGRDYYRADKVVRIDDRHTEYDRSAQYEEYSRNNETNAFPRLKLGSPPSAYFYAQNSPTGSSSHERRDLREFREGRDTRGREDSDYDGYRGQNSGYYRRGGGPRAHRRLDYGREGDTRFFVIKSFNEENVRRSMEDGLWTTQLENGKVLEEAFKQCKNVVLVFSVNKSKAFQGWARMETKPDASIPRPSWMKVIHWETTSPFRIDWHNKTTTEFFRIHHLKNSLNENEPVLVAKDGQEIEEQCGRQLLEEMDRIAEIRAGSGAYVYIPKDHKQKYQTWVKREGNGK